jgi:hypothetical protein
MDSPVFRHQGEHRRSTGLPFPRPHLPVRKTTAPRLPVGEDTSPRLDAEANIAHLRTGGQTADTQRNSSLSLIWSGTAPRRGATGIVNPKEALTASGRSRVGTLNFTARLQFESCDDATFMRELATGEAEGGVKVKHKQMAKDFLRRTREVGAMDVHLAKLKEWGKNAREARKRGEKVWVHPEEGEGRVHLWNSHHKAWLPWSDKDVFQTPHWTTFVADAIGKHPSKRSDNERRAIKLAMAKDSHAGEKD